MTCSIIYLISDALKNHFSKYTLQTVPALLFHYLSFIVLHYVCNVYRALNCEVSNADLLLRQLA